MPRKSTLKARHGCQACRNKHLKCDAGVPSCARCLSAGVECIRGTSIRFKNVDSSKYPPSQQWVSSSGSHLRFIDQTKSTIEGDEEPGASFDPAVSPSDASFHVTETDGTGGHGGLSQPIDYSLAPNDSHEPERCSSYAHDSTERDSRLSSEQIEHIRSYIDLVSPSLDVFDKDRYFTYGVPQRALSEPSLVDAITALSKALPVNDWQRTSWTELLNAVQAAGGRSRDLELDEHGCSLLVLLRYNAIRHFFTIGARASWESSTAQLLAIDIVWSCEQRTATTMALITQGIQLSLLSQRTISLHFNCSWDDVINNLNCDDFKWAHAVVLLCAQAIDFCFGEHISIFSQHSSLTHLLEDWMTHRPAAFDAVQARDKADHSLFPRILLLNDFAVAAMQYYYLTRILLTLYDPEVPRLGLGRRKAVKQRDKDTLTYLRCICGLAISNKPLAHHWMFASACITAFGELSTESKEQEMFCDVLNKTSKDFMWPLESAINHLRIAWKGK